MQNEMRKSNLAFSLVLFAAFLLAPTLAMANSYGGGGYGGGNYGLGEQASPPGQQNSLQTQGEEVIGDDSGEAVAPNAPSEDSGEPTRKEAASDAPNTPEADQNDRDGTGTEGVTASNESDASDPQGSVPTTNPSLQERVQNNALFAKALLAVAAIALIGVLGTLLRPRPSRLP